ncbi:MAG: TonB-dependent receptor [Ferruginibacter sp.]|nr:TonB-dependent receptor [Cytophagales bacterium]
MKKTDLLIPVLLFLLFFNRSIAFAQSGRITGEIRDEQNLPLPGATVTLDQTNRGTTTDAAGRFNLENVPAGTYQLTIRFLGYKTVVLPVVTGTDAAPVRVALAPDALLMDAVVVTGTANPQTKLESTVAVTTLNAAQIQNRVPRGTADLLMAVPGFRVNSDGGEAANSISARGLPVSAEAGFGFLQLMEDNLPVFEVPNLTFAKTDIHFRVDETLARLEVVRGGSAGIFANNAPGGIINFLSKTGGDRFGGVVKLTGGDQGLGRFDVNVGGPVGENWRYNVGGFYRYDRGVKYAGYPANVGGGIKANLTRKFDQGYVRLYGKYLNDRIVYITSIPFQNLRDPREIPGGPGFRRGTQYSEYERRTTLPDAFNGGQTRTERDLADGQHTRYSAVTAEFFYDFGNDFTLTNTARALNANLSTDGIYDLNAPYVATQLAGALANGYRPFGVTGYEFSYADNGQVITDVTGLNGNGLVNIGGFFPDEKPARNLINSLKLAKKLGGHALAAGFYLSLFNIKEKLNFNLVLQEVANRPRLLNLRLTGSPLGPFELTQNGFYEYSIPGGYYNSNNDTRVASFFLSDEWKVSDQLRLDGGVRLETTHTNGSAENAGQVVQNDPAFAFLGAGANGGLDGKYTTIYDNRYTVGTGTFREWDYDFTTFNASLGANYSFTKQVAVYARASTAGSAPSNDQWVFGADAGGNTVKGEVQRILQGEAGIKLSTGQIGLFLTGFFSRNDNIPFTIQTAGPNNTFILTQQRGRVESYGTEVEASYSPVKSLNLKAIATIQNPTFREFSFSDPLANNALVSFKGNQIDDTPRVLLDFTADYTLKGFNAFANYRYFGERYANKRNTLKLPEYGILFGGVSYQWQKLRFGVQGSNLLDTVGFGDVAARNGESVTPEFVNDSNPGADGKTNAERAYNLIRPILPRNVTFSVAYTF